MQGKPNQARYIVLHTVYALLIRLHNLLHHPLPRSQDHVIPALLEQTLALILVLRPRILGLRRGGFGTVSGDLGCQIVPGDQVLGVWFRGCRAGGGRWCRCAGREVDLGLEGEWGLQVPFISTVSIGSE